MCPPEGAGVRTLLRGYGWLFAASGAVFVAAPEAVSSILNEAALRAGAHGLDQGGRTYWLALTGSMMAMIAHLAFALARDPGNAAAWRTLLLSKAVSTAAFLAFAPASGRSLFLLGAAVDGAILLHLGWLCRRAADLGLGAEGYEAWFVRLRDPGTGAALWLRRAEHAGAAARTELWWTLFQPGLDGVASGTLVLPRSRSADSLEAPAILRFEGPARWEVSLRAGAAPPFRFAPLLSGAGLASASYEAALPAAEAAATFSFDGRELDLRGAEASVGRIRGRRSARAWRWLHARFEDPEDGRPTVVEILSARVAAWPFGWLTGAHLWHRGRHLRADGLWSLAANRSAREGEAWTVACALPGVDLELECARDPLRLARFESPDADGKAVRVGTSMTARASLTLRRPGEPPWRAETRGAAVEFGGEDA